MVTYPIKAQETYLNNLSSQLKVTLFQNSME